MRKRIARGLVAALSVAAAASLTFVVTHHADAAVATVNVRILGATRSQNSPPGTAQFSAAVENIGVNDLPARNSDGVGGYTVTVSYSSLLTPQPIAQGTCVQDQPGRCTITFTNGIPRNARGRSPVVQFTGDVLSVPDSSKITFRLGTPGFRNLAAPTSTSCPFR